MPFLSPGRPGSDFANMLMGMGNQRFAQQNRYLRNFISPFLVALGLKDPEQAMSVLGPIFQGMFAQDVEQIGQSFGSGRTGLIDALASSGFRTGSQAAGLSQSYLGQAQSEVMAKRARLSEQLQSLFGGSQIATNMFGQMNPNQYYQNAANWFQFQSPSTLSNIMPLIQMAASLAGGFAGGLGGGGIPTGGSIAPSLPPG